MHELSVGSVICQLDSEHLTFQDQQCGTTIRMALGYIPDLLRFLQWLDYRDYIRAFRVPTDDDCGLVATVSHGDQLFETAPVNLSLVGICADIDCDESLPVGLEVTVRLGLGEKETRLTGIVRRRQDANIGIEFDNCFKDGCLEPPETLRQIVAALETLWLRARAALGRQGAATPN